MSETEIKDRVHQLVDESDGKILRAVEAMLEAWQEENWSKEAIDDLNLDIEESEIELKKGESHTHEEVVKISEQWQHRKR